MTDTTAAPPKRCEAPGCDREVYCRWRYCALHYMRQRRHGSFDLPVKVPKICACGGVVKAKGLCPKCYSREIYRKQCERTGQPIPQSYGEIAATVFQGIALKYRRVLAMSEELTGKRAEALNIVGGGTQNRLLSQFAANAIGRPAVTGPIEATAAGNILMQMLALGAVGSLAEGREVIRLSFPVETFEPQDVSQWEEAYGKLCALE